MLFFGKFLSAEKAFWKKKQCPELAKVIILLIYLPEIELIDIKFTQTFSRNQTIIDQHS